MENESSALNPYNGMFGQQGWVCPKCGKVFSPFTSECLYCNKEKIRTNTTTINIVKDMQSNITSTETVIKCDKKSMGNIDVSYIDGEKI